MKKLAVKKIAEELKIKISREAEFILVINLIESIKDTLTQAAKEANFFGRKIISKKDMETILNKSRIIK